MAQSDILKFLFQGSAPKKLRVHTARGLIPLPPKEMLEALVYLLKDADQDIAAQAVQTIGNWAAEDILVQLKDRGCNPSVLEHFTSCGAPESLLYAAISNPSAPAVLIEQLSLTASTPLLEAILDNRVRILAYPGILANIKRNPAATPEIMRLAQEIETEFLGDKKKNYTIEAAQESPSAEDPVFEFLSENPPEDLTLEGLPQDTDARQYAIAERLSRLSVREKIRYALFGAREIRAMLVRDTNREVARAVLHSPKLTESEIESISAMRGVAEEILREIGNKKEWTKNYGVVQNLVKNPKTPPMVSQRMLFRLHNGDLQLLAKDRGIPEAVRMNAIRTLSQRTANRSHQ